MVLVSAQWSVPRRRSASYGQGGDGPVEVRASCVSLVLVLVLGLGPSAEVTNIVG